MILNIPAKPHGRPALIAAALLILCAGVSAQLPNYPDFGSVAGMAMVGTASQNGAALELNPVNGGTGAAWFNAQVPIGAGFTTTFDFRIVKGNAGGDGMAFVLQNSAAGSKSPSECRPKVVRAPAGDREHDQLTR